MDRCYNDTITSRGLDPSSGKACGGMLSDKRRLVDVLGRGNEGKCIRSRFKKMKLDEFSIKYENSMKLFVVINLNRMCFHS